MGLIEPRLLNAYMGHPKTRQARRWPWRGGRWGASLPLNHRQDTPFGTKTRD